jgi:hypothetical protein
MRAAVALISPISAPPSAIVRIGRCVHASNSGSSNWIFISMPSNGQTLQIDTSAVRAQCPLHLQ